MEQAICIDGDIGTIIDELRKYSSSHRAVKNYIGFTNQHFLQNVSGPVLLKSTHFAKSVVLFVCSFSYNDFKLKAKSKKTN
ncbi:hypothetical protein [Butyrivibrio sp. TB]|uniref:hypothetical protein n=1 Tax=Butyrivibrio sp. TB TaxID=1520809 RepID=UPI0008B22D7E|nr:hypothetical protein [Butyrivibrio sp. TB]SEQ67068.1 hypothetical protein SAMN02910382_03737 [Butyrivibrio sp. TB]